MTMLFLFACVFLSVGPCSLQATTSLSLLDEREGVFFCSLSRVSICGCREKKKRLNVNGVLKEERGGSQVVLVVKNPPQCRRCKRCGFNPWVRKIPWRRAWQPTPIFLPGESLGQRSLVNHGP